MNPTTDANFLMSSNKPIFSRQTRPRVLLQKNLAKGTLLRCYSANAFVFSLQVVLFRVVCRACRKRKPREKKWPCEPTSFQGPPPSQGKALAKRLPAIFKGSDFEATVFRSGFHAAHFSCGFLSHHARRIKRNRNYS